GSSNPDVSWSFNNSYQPDDGRIMATLPGQMSGEIFTTDRFGFSNSALFTGNPQMKLSMNSDHPFFGLNAVPTEVTITCWIKLDNLEGYKTLFLGDDRFGLVIKEGVPGLRRNKGAAPQPWDFTMIEPGWRLEQEGAGWYFVALVCKQYVTRMFVGKY